MKLALKAIIILLVSTAAYAVDERPIWQQEVEDSAPPAENPLVQPKHSYSPSEEALPPEDDNLEYQPPTDVETRYKPANNPDISEIKVEKKTSEESNENDDKGAEAQEPAPVQELPKWVETNAGKIKVLNKIFTRTTEFTIKKNHEVKSGSISIRLEKCFRQPESDRKESAALLLIKENFKATTPVELFHGWMFSDSPAISALEHQQYNVILLTCEDAKKSEPQNKPEVKTKNDKTIKPDNKAKNASKKN